MSKVRVSEKTVVESLTAALKDEYIIVRRNSALALGELGSVAKSTIPSLTALQKDKSQVVRDVAKQALNSITPSID